MQLLYFIASLASLVAAQSTTATLESSTTSAALPSISSQTASPLSPHLSLPFPQPFLQSQRQVHLRGTSDGRCQAVRTRRLCLSAADPNARTSDSVRSGTSSQGGPVDQTVLSSIATSAGRRNSGGFARGAASAALLTAALLAL
ncbi:hypothetical protein BC831DRAFT_476932 [Entophlyctis helioformis]|nr:hypothetical protein BC831DRAFT_476932 [Entophlyctis helioformis]